MTRTYLIDLPFPSANIKEWEDFIKEMKKLPQDDENVRDSIEIAETIIKQKKERAGLL